MEEPQETPKKPRPVMNGNETGIPFSKDNQPSPEAKKAGWEEFRKQRHLTQSIIKAMIGEDGKPTETFTSYIEALIKNAKSGNPKAIDVISKCIEEEITKIEHSGELTVKQITGMTVI